MLRLLSLSDCYDVLFPFVAFPRFVEIIDLFILLLLDCDAPS